jgi:hypothetical protein
MTGILDKVKKAGAFLATAASGLTITAGLSLTGPEISLKFTPPTITHLVPTSDISTKKELIDLRKAPTRDISTRKELIDLRKAPVKDCESLVSLASRFNQPTILPDQAFTLDAIENKEIRKILGNAMAYVAAHTNAGPDKANNMHALNKMSETLKEARTVIKEKYASYHQAEETLLRTSFPTQTDCIGNITSTKNYISMQMQRAAAEDITLRTLGTLQASFDRSNFIASSDSMTEGNKVVLEAAQAISKVLGTNFIQQSYYDAYATALPPYMDKGRDSYDYLKDQAELTNLLDKIKKLRTEAAAIKHS